MCGGDITPKEGTNIGTCNYCKSIMTLPNLDDEKIVNLYNRANFLRISNDFDRAKGIYESILELNNSEIEAHWGIILCKYGVEYIDDPKTMKKVPTCHRTIESSILEDSDYKFIKDKAYGEALDLYKSEAKQINDIQKRILEISNKEQNYDIFICYKETDDNGERTYDSVLAQTIYDNLIDEGYKVFFSRITLEGKLGSEFEPYIFSALSSAKVMLVVGTNEKNLNAVWVKNEWSRYLEFAKKNKNKVLIPVYSKMDAYELPDSFSMLQGQNMDKIGAMQDLISGINKIIKKDVKKVEIEPNISNELIQKFKRMVEEQERAEEDARKRSERFEVRRIKVVPKKSFIIISFLLSAIMGIIMILSINNLIFYKTNSISKPLTFRGALPDIIQFYVGIIVFIAFFLGIISKKSHKASKYLYFSAIILEMYAFIKTFLMDYRMSYPFFCIVLLNVALIILKPTWQLKPSFTEFVSESEKEIIEKENEEIEANFTSKDKGFVIKPIYLIIVILSLVSAFILNFKAIASQGNLKDPTVKQIKINTEYINIRQKYGVGNKEIGKVFKGELYTVLSEKEYYGTTWYEIKTDKGIVGYISGGKNNEYVIIYNVE